MLQRCCEFGQNFLKCLEISWKCNLLFFCARSWTNFHEIGKFPRDWHLWMNIIVEEMHQKAAWSLKNIPPPLQRRKQFIKKKKLNKLIKNLLTRWVACPELSCWPWKANKPVLLECSRSLCDDKWKQNKNMIITNSDGNKIPYWGKIKLLIWYSKLSQELLGKTPTRF